MRPPISTLAAALLLSGLAAGCGRGVSEVIADYRFGSAFRECAPWDGAAFHVILGPEELADTAYVPAPGVELRIYDAPERAAGRMIRLEGFDDRGAILRCPTSGPCDPALEGTVRIVSASKDTIRGWIDAEWPDGSNVRTAFAAAWKERTVFCG